MGTNEEDDTLEHHGVLGMHWGQHKNRQTSYRRGQAPPKRKGLSKNQKVAIGAGAVGVAAAAMLGAAFISKKSGVKLSSIPGAQSHMWNPNEFQDLMDAFIKGHNETIFSMPAAAVPKTHAIMDGLAAADRSALKSVLATGSKDSVQKWLSNHYKELIPAPAVLAGFKG